MSKLLLVGAAAGAGVIALAAVAAARGGGTPPPPPPVLSVDGSTASINEPVGATPQIVVTGGVANAAFTVHRTGNPAQAGVVYMSGVLDSSGGFAGLGPALPYTRGTHYLYARSHKVDSNDVTVVTA